QLHPALPSDGAYDLAGGFVAGGDELGTGRGCLRAGRLEAPESTLDRSSVVGARDDFLARIAAFVEGDGTQGIEIEHLWQIMRCERRHELRDAQPDLGE